MTPSLSTPTLISDKALFQTAEQNSTYTGPRAYARLLIRENLELYSLSIVCICSDKLRKRGGRHSRIVSRGRTGGETGSGTGTAPAASSDPTMAIYWIGPDLMRRPTKCHRDVLRAMFSREKPFEEYGKRRLYRAEKRHSVVLRRVARPNSLCHAIAGASTLYAITAAAAAAGHSSRKIIEAHSNALSVGKPIMIHRRRCPPPRLRTRMIPNPNKTYTNTCTVLILNQTTIG
jgi:hypothetical protein